VINVGTRLKEIRSAMGLTQRELARRAGVTNGMISLVEQNQTSPSVASLKRILDAFEMSFSEFFAEENAFNGKVFFKPDELYEINPQQLFDIDAATARLLSLKQVGDSSRHNLQMLLETYQPGADTGKELYSHQGEEAGIVIEGEIELTVGDQVQILSKGDAYFFDSQSPHRFKNLNDSVCVIVSACTPPTF
jgi:transcriptional regulator with XRE-family HTH domain